MRVINQQTQLEGPILYYIYYYGCNFGPAHQPLRNSRRMFKVVVGCQCYLPKLPPGSGSRYRPATLKVLQAGGLECIPELLSITFSKTGQSKCQTCGCSHRLHHCEMAVLAGLKWFKIL